MPQILSAAEFFPGDLSLVQRFDCGSLPWQEAQSDWIKAPTTKKLGTSQHNTDIWLYYHPDGSLVGFGSLGVAKWSDPYPNGPRFPIALIPNLALQRQYWGLPANDPPKFSHQILGDLLGKSLALGTQFIALLVHEQNAPAISLYEAFQFTKVPNYKVNSHIRMRRQIR